MSIYYLLPAIMIPIFFLIKRNKSAQLISWYLSLLIIAPIVLLSVFVVLYLPGDSEFGPSFGATLIAPILTSAVLGSVVLLERNNLQSAWRGGQLKRISAVLIGILIISAAFISYSGYLGYYRALTG